MPDHDIIPTLRQKLLQGVRPLPVLPLPPSPASLTAYYSILKDWIWLL